MDFIYKIYSFTALKLVKEIQKGKGNETDNKISASIQNTSYDQTVQMSRNITLHVIDQTVQMFESHTPVQVIDQTAQMLESNPPVQVVDQTAQMSKSNPVVQVMDQTVQMLESNSPLQVINQTAQMFGKQVTSTSY